MMLIPRIFASAVFRFMRTVEKIEDDSFCNDMRDFFPLGRCARQKCHDLKTVFTVPRLLD